MFWLFFFFFQLKSGDHCLIDLKDVPQIHLGNFGSGIEEWEEMMTESSSPFWVRNNRVYMKYRKFTKHK